MKRRTQTRKQNRNQEAAGAQEDVGRAEEEKISSLVEQGRPGKRRRGRLRKWFWDETVGEEDQEAVEVVDRCQLEQ